MFENGEKPLIEYPCWWEYKIFLAHGVSAEGVASEAFVEVFGEAFGEVFGGDVKFDLALSKRNAKFCCYNLRVFVGSEEERLGLFGALKKRAAFVL